MLLIPFFYVKDKQAFLMENGCMKLIGKPIDVAKRLQKEGARLIHIIDLDAKKGLPVNFDLYNHMTYFINIEVEIAAKKELIATLLNLEARAVIALPAKTNLKQFASRKRLLVGKIAPGFKGNLDDVFDIIIDFGKQEIDYKNLQIPGKRIIILAENADEKKLTKADVFGIIKKPVLQKS